MIIKKIRRICRNLYYNFRYLLSNDIASKLAAATPENLQYELPEYWRTQRKIKIYSIENTLEYLTTHNVSFCRFGDGELELIAGKSISFQQANEKLSYRLQEVLSSQDKNIIIGLPYALFTGKSHLLEIVSDFWYLHGEKYRDIIFQYYHPNQQYYAAEMTLPVAMYKEYDLDKYFKQLRSLWENKKIALIYGEGILHKFKFNIFDNASTTYHIVAPSKNAFKSYTTILQQVQKLEKDTLLLIILGPTATVLAYDLAHMGYRALDIGHVAKAYDWYMTKMRVPTNLPSSFFNPD